MAVVEGGVSGALAGVGAEAASPLHVVSKPTSHGALGHYRVAATTGTLAAALAASAQLFYLRWTDATRFCVITYFRAQFQTLTPFTAATLTDFGFDLHKATAVSAGGGGTDLGASVKTRMRTGGMGASLLDAAGLMRIGTTAGLTAITTLDALPIAQSLGDTQSVNPAAGTEEQRVNDPTLIFAPNLSRGEHPLVLAQNEGLVLRNRTVWPAAGTGIVQIEIAWSEVTAF
jgi:hypothetical protein